MTNRASSSANVTWSSYNYPTVISATDATGSEEVQFAYGPDHQRWEQIYTVSGTTEQTYYIGGLVDLVFSGGTTNFRHYIYAGGEPVAVYSRTAAGANTMSYMIEDHQGGVSAIVSSAGTTDVDESFTAFGARRNPATWSGPPTTSDLNTIESLSRQGYTFQTSLGQSMGLNHMKGRVQDAISGRFLSADPSITDPSNAQSYNRFSYVNNMPATMIDPSGFTLRKNCRNGFCPGDINNLYSGMGGAASGGGGGGTEVDSDDDTGAFGNDASGPSTQAWFTGSLADSDLPGVAEVSPDTSDVGSPPDSTGANGDGTSATSTGLASTGSAAQSQDTLSELTVTAQSTANQSSNSAQISYPALSDPNYFTDLGSNQMNAGFGPQKGPFGKSPTAPCAWCGQPGNAGSFGSYCPTCTENSLDPANGIPPDPNPADWGDDQDQHPSNSGKMPSVPILPAPQLGPSQPISPALPWILTILLFFNALNTATGN